MPSALEDYVSQLQDNLAGSDPATVRDALSDAEEHLRSAFAALRETHPELSEPDAFEKAVQQYGTPAEIAAAYSQAGRGMGASVEQAGGPASSLGRFFAIYNDPHAWGSLLYMLLSLVTGIIYFAWVATGLSLSVGLSLFIFGLPLAILFLISVRGLAFLEGRRVEGVLGENMLPRPLLMGPGMKWLERLKFLLTDRHTWLAMLYMLLQVVLGMLYFTLVVTAFTFSVGFMGLPVFQSIWKDGVITIGYGRVFFPVWTYPFLILFGFLLWTVFMHVGRFIGRWHGKYAKALLSGG
ncbi:MAG: sensor domain-containing protein [Bacteroidota bacterium]